MKNRTIPYGEMQQDLHKICVNILAEMKSLGSFYSQVKRIISITKGDLLPLEQLLNITTELNNKLPKNIKDKKNIGKDLNSLCEKLKEAILLKQNSGITLIIDKNLHKRGEYSLLLFDPNRYESLEIESKGDEEASPTKSFCIIS